MKCRFCGTELSDDAKFCSRCGRKVEADLQYSDHMDSNIPEDAYYRKIDDKEYAAIKKKVKEEEKIKEEVERRNIAEERKNDNGRKGAKKKAKKKARISSIAYILLILVGGFALYKTGIVDNIVSGVSGSSAGSQKTKQVTSEKKSDKTEETAGKTAGQTEEKKQDYEEQVLDYTDNRNMDVESCLDPADYAVVTSQDGSFSFGYPKYLFDYSKVNTSGTSYTLSYGKGSSKKAELTVYTEENAGNALDNAKQLYRKYSSSVYKIYFKMQPTRIDSEGMGRTLIGGAVDSSESEGIYIIAANDGEKNYILKFTYPDPDMDYDYNEIDYVVDCVYRYCSFSGGTYKPRTYQQFLKDDMGTKK